MANKLSQLISLSLIFSAGFALPAIAMDSNQSIEFYQSHYPLQNDTEKLVDNQGNGFDALYGVRNFRSVLNGVVYRGGANNAYNKYQKRSNENPLPTMGLTNLCEQGFGTAVYLYSTNFSTAAKQTNCQSLFGSSNQLQYKSLPPLGNATNQKAILQLVYDRLNSTTDEAPIYLHCWNGWHASGFISALILRQFCGFTGAQAVNYWNENTDGNDVGSSYDKIRAQITAFTPLSGMQISTALQERVCPQP